MLKLAPTWFWVDQKGRTKTWNKSLRQLLQTPFGHIAVLVVGLILAFGLWHNRSTIDLLFFRLSGGNTRVGHAAGVAAPVVAFAVFCLITF